MADEKKFASGVERSRTKGNVNILARHLLNMRQRKVETEMNAE